ncbi:MAG: hypothetical protein U1A27_13110 [Phycisphaerae bacterium]
MHLLINGFLAADPQSFASQYRDPRPAVARRNGTPDGANLHSFACAGPDEP